MTKDQRIEPIELNDHRPLAATLLVLSALQEIGAPATIGEILRVLETSPYVRVTKATRSAVRKVLRQRFMIERVGKETWQLAGTF